jgi:hypothetical protein
LGLKVRELLLCTLLWLFVNYLDPTRSLPHALYSEQKPYTTGMTSSQTIQSRLNALAQQPFRARFHLGPRERHILETKGLPTIRQHATELIARRLAPAVPPNDGKQTPYRGHPVFVGQHATGTCCRSCLSKWHRLPPGRALTPEEQEYIVDVLVEWLERETENKV